MMKHISNLLLVGLLAFAAVFIIPFAYDVGKTKKTSTDIASAIGRMVIDYEPGGYIALEFDRKIISGCGPVTILGFVENADGQTIQLKPLLLPQEEALKQANVLIFPTWDVAGFLQKSGKYTIKLYVKNECSFLDHKTIKLKPITFGIKEKR